MAVGEITFTIGGELRRVTSEQVERVAARLEPGTIQSHAVDVRGRRFPVKQLFAATTGLDLLDFTTNQARRVLKRLGFEVMRIN